MGRTNIHPGARSRSRHVLELHGWTDESDSPDESLTEHLRNEVLISAPDVIPWLEGEHTQVTNQLGWLHCHSSDNRRCHRPWREFRPNADPVRSTPRGSSLCHNVGVADAEIASQEIAATRLGFQPALDGMRAAAVTMVIAAHMAVFHSEGGIIGVHIFFTLSGFLITTLLMQEQRSTEHISLRVFYWRRGVRLLPALFAVVVVTDTYLFFDHQNPVRSVTIGSTVPVLLYFSNWEWFVHGTGSLGWFGHMWSLSVEEQYYIAWPLFLVLVKRRRWSPTRHAAVVSALCLLSLALRVAGPRATTTGATFFGTPMIAEILLVGALAALLLGDPSTRVKAAAAGRMLQGPALTYLAFYFLAFGTPLLANSDVTGGPALSLVGAATAILIVRVVTAPQARLARMLSLRPLVFLGGISYGMYLWHILICYALAEQVTFGHGAHPLYWVLGYAGTVGAALGSRQLVEGPAARLRDRVGSTVVAAATPARTTHPATGVES